MPMIPAVGRQRRLGDHGVLTGAFPQVRGEATAAREVEEVSVVECSIERMFEGSPGVDLVAALAGAAERADLEERVDRIAGWERVVSWAQGMQAREIAALAAGRAAEDAAAGLWTSDQGRRAADEVALARRVSPTAGAAHVAFARGLVEDHAGTLAALLTGRLGGLAARTIVGECAVLDPQLRRQVDPPAAAEAAELTPGQVRSAIARRVIAADPAAAERRAQAARKDRAVALLPGKDATAALWARLPAEQAVACWQALDTHARSLRAGGDPRPLHHLRCDTLVERVTGASAAHGPPVEVGVVISAATLLGLDSTPATLHGYGALPAGVARQLAASPHSSLRRLVTDPLDGRLLTLDTRRRRFDGALRRLITTRDQTCRGVGCTAPIRDIDHVVTHAAGGATSAANGHGLCQRTHTIRDHPGWALTTHPDSSITWTTPTGHHYTSRPPPVLGHGSLTPQQLTRRPRPTPSGPSPPDRPPDRPPD